MEWARNDGYAISDDRARVDDDAVWRYLAQESYWGHGLERDVLERALDNSLCFGVYALDGTLAGFARMVTDRATFGYLADVFVLEAHRGRGLSTWLTETILGHPELVTLRRWVLFTADAHDLYERFGFVPGGDAEMLMTRVRGGGPAGG